MVILAVLNTISALTNKVPLVPSPITKAPTLFGRLVVIVMVCESLIVTVPVPANCPGYPCGEVPEGVTQVDPLKYCQLDKLVQAPVPAER
jgi:hypothetical protein